MPASDLPSFRVCPVLADAWRVWRQAPVRLIALNMLPNVPLLSIAMLTGVPAEKSPMLNGLVLAAWVTLFCLAQGMTISLVHDLMCNDGIDGTRAFVRSWRRLPALIGAGILSWLLLSLGFAALVAPGFMAICVLFVALPAVTIEGRGPVEGLERSGELTQGHRWKILAIFLIASLPVLFAALIVDGLIDSSRMPSLAAAFDEIFATLYSALAGILTSVTHYWLVRMKNDMASKIAALP